MTASDETLKARWHDLDAVRALALLLGVALHATMSFLTPRIWIVDDSHHAQGLGVVFFVIHMFRMVTFFALAGFFARMGVQKRGAGGFIGNRLIHVGVPLVGFWPLILTAIIATAIIANPAVPGAPASPPPALSVATFPLTHLWFLYVLLGLYAGAMIIKLVGDVLHIGGVFGRAVDAVMGLLVRTDLAIAVLALPVGLVFFGNDKWLMWFGVMTPDTGLVPNTMAIAAYVTAFAFGWYLHRSPQWLDHFAKRWLLNAGSAVAFTAVCLYLAGSNPAISPVAGRDHVLYIFAYTLGAWSWVLTLIGAAHRFLHRENPALRYLADASYWIYIVHLPILMGFQVIVRTLDWPAEAKFALVLLSTVALVLLSYQLLVRYSFIGAILNGRRKRSRGKPAGQEAMA